MKKGHVPIRQCVGCKLRKEKNRMLRFVHAAGEEWQLDPKERLPGRGAYLCSVNCLERLKRNKRYRTLGTTAQGIAAGMWPALSAPQPQ